MGKDKNMENYKSVTKEEYEKFLEDYKKTHKIHVNTYSGWTDTYLVTNGEVKLDFAIARKVEGFMIREYFILKRCLEYDER